MSDLKVPVKQFKYNEFTNKQMLSQGGFGSREFGKTFVAKYPGYEWVTIQEVSHDIHTNKRKLQKSANSLHELNGHYVVNFLGVVLESRNTCLVMEFMKFLSLNNYMLTMSIEYFDWPIRLRVLHQVAKALNYLHSKDIFHQSLDASVVMLDAYLNVKLAECGFRQLTMRTWMDTAKTYQHTNRLSQPQTNVSLFAPEQINNINTNPSGATDMYSYGILIWHVITRKTPFLGKSNDEVFKLVGQDKQHPGEIPKDDDVPQVLIDILKCCWDFEPSKRLSASTVVDKLKLSSNQKLEANTIAHEASKIYKSYCTKNNLPILSDVVDSAIKPRITERNQLVCHPSTEHSIETSPKTLGYKEESEEVHGEPSNPLLKADPFLEPATEQQSTVGTLGSSSGTDSRFGSSEFLDETTYPLTTTASSMLTTPGFPSIPITPGPGSQSSVTFVDSQSSVVSQISIPAEGSPSPITPKHLYQIAQHMGNRWRRFGELILQYSEGELDAFEYGQNDLRDVIYKMLANWVDSLGGKHVVSVGRLIAKLKEGYLNDVALRVEP